MSRPISRGDLCPCGSGRKYKHCCAGKQRFRMGGTLWVLVGMGVVAVVAGVLMTRRGDGVVPRVPAGMPSATNGPAAEPWAYDSVTKRHYDPAHGHWHDGPPPPPEARGLAAPAPPGTATPDGPTPAAWTHDVAGNRHWDPNHGHWHPGPPPPGAK